jgi:hypothetical protein
MAPFLWEISLFDFKYFEYVQIVDQQCSITRNVGQDGGHDKKLRNKMAAGLFRGWRVTGGG